MRRVESGSGLGMGVSLVEGVDALYVFKCRAFGWVCAWGDVRSAAFSFSLSKRRVRRHRERPAEVPFLPVM